MSKSLNSLLVLGLIASMQPVENAQASPSASWARENLQGGEALMCSKSLEGESFFVGQAGNKLKLGYRLKVPSPDNPFSLLASWRIINNKGKDVTASTPPKAVVARVVQDGQQLYSESIEYQDLTEAMLAPKVELRVKKCSSDDCDVNRRRSPNEVEYVVNVCD
jgi:hypothetical protein